MYLARTTAALGSAAATAAVVALADAAREHDGPAVLDPRLAADIDRARSGPLNLLAHLLTFLGSEVVVGAAAVVLMLVLLRRRWYAEAAALGIGMLGSAVMIIGIKHLVMRPRPPAADRLGPVDHSFSFPSGHTLNSAVFLGLVVLTVGWWLPRGQRAVAIAAVVLLGFGVGLSRLYLGYHWGTDVLASWLLAGAWIACVALAMPALRHVAARAVSFQSGVFRDPGRPDGPSTDGRREGRDIPWQTNS